MRWNANWKMCWIMVVVLGIGNLLLSDEGFGVQVVKILQQHYQLPPGVSAVDGGTLGWELVPVLEDARSLIIIDAILGNQPPGTIYRFDQDEVTRYFHQKLSAHEAGIQEILAYLAMKGKTFDHLVILGVEPASLDTGIQLSPTVAGTVPQVIEAVLQQLAQWGYAVPPAPPLADHLETYLRSMHP